MSIVPISRSSALAKLSPFEQLANISEERVWLANFTSKQTRDTYKNAISDLIEFLELRSADELRAIDRAHIIAWRDHLMEHGASNSTVVTRLSAVSSMFQHLCERQVAPKNPVSGVKRPKVSSQTVKTPALATHQVRAMLDMPDTSTLQGLRDCALLHVYFYAGTRVSEPCKLRVRDLTEEQGVPVLDFAVKGGKSLRVGIHPACVQAIHAYMEVMRAEQGEAYSGDAWMFQAIMNGTDGPMTRLQFYNLFKKYAIKAGLPVDTVPHSARATFITEALDRDHPSDAVQKTVGHASITTTLAYDKRRKKVKDSASFVVRY
ncbi:tyrosine-type recombinase/integrase [Lentilitoribacter sp. EG35]|uniref:tyrosine-type recombinase/integrase n=1 Tax=Lentilitoribacter sp. EG35 TaxID=3234192 RepID=UPI00345F8FE4